MLKRFFLQVRRHHPVPWPGLSVLRLPAYRIMALPLIIAIYMPPSFGKPGFPSMLALIVMAHRQLPLAVQFIAQV